MAVARACATRAGVAGLMRTATREFSQQFQNPAERYWVKMPAARLQSFRLIERLPHKAGAIGQLHREQGFLGDPGKQPTRPRGLRTTGLQYPLQLVAMGAGASVFRKTKPICTAASANPQCTGCAPSRPNKQQSVCRCRSSRPFLPVNNPPPNGACHSRPSVRRADAHRAQGFGATLRARHANGL